MEAVFTTLLVLVFVGGLIAVIAAYNRKLVRQRKAGIAELAEEMSLEFFPEGDTLLESALSHLPLMQRGRRREMTNLVRGQTQDVDMALFDYRYTTGSGKHQATHHLSVVAFQSMHLDLPAFELGPEQFFHRLVSAFGFQNIDFAGYPTFNKRYLLRGPDEDAIRASFTEPVIQHFEEQLQTRKTIAEVIGQGDRLLIAARREAPEKLRAFLEQAFATYGTFKAQAAEAQAAHEEA